MNQSAIQFPRHLFSINGSSSKASKPPCQSVSQSTHQSTILSATEPSKHSICLSVLFPSRRITQSITYLPDRPLIFCHPVTKVISFLLIRPPSQCVSNLTNYSCIQSLNISASQLISRFLNHFIPHSLYQYFNQSVSHFLIHVIS